MSAIPEAALGAMVAAIATSLVALLGLIISKENKTSEFRQAWIDALRSDIADLIGHLNAVVGTIRKAGRETEAWVGARDDVGALNRCMASIRLRLNPTETQSKVICTLLDDLDRLLVREGDLAEDRIDAVEKRLVIEGQVILKEEWMRVRRGEVVFRSLRVGSFVVLAAAIIAIVYWLGAHIAA